jgi:hypothetical protein
MLTVILVSPIQSVVIQSVAIQVHYAECHYGVLLIVIMQSGPVKIIILCVGMSSVTILIVAAPFL